MNNFENILDIDQVRLEPSELVPVVSIIFMDCNMPILDGYCATSAIKKFYKEELKMNDAPLIVGATGHTELEYMRKAKNSGMDCVLSKPISKDDLQTILQLFQVS